MTGWLDLSAGVSGDMLLGALVGAGVDLELLRATLAPLGVDVTLDVEDVHRAGLAATRVHVTAPDDGQPARRLPDVEALLDRLTDTEVADGARAVFQRLAEVEARAHGVDVTDVHFHEVGALDAIADIVGVVAGFASLGLDALHAGPIGLGAGRVGASHGSLPVPVPAVVSLAAGNPVEAGPAPFESATPTGVALVTHLVTSWTGLPPMVVDRIGVGAGGRDPASHPNVTRLVLGTATPDGHVVPATPAFQVECNVDDMDPRLWPTVIDRVLGAGAVDAWLTPIHMKKGRPAITFSALCVSAALVEVERAILTHTTSIGVRVRQVAKVALDRHHTHVEVEGHRVAVKVALLDGVVVNRSVEWDDVEAAAGALGRPAVAVLAEAQTLADATDAADAT